MLRRFQYKGWFSLGATSTFSEVNPVNFSFTEAALDLAADAGQRIDFRGSGFISRWSSASRAREGIRTLRGRLPASTAPRPP